MVKCVVKFWCFFSKGENARKTMPILRRTLRRIPNLHTYSETLTLPETSPAKLRQQKITNKKCFRHSQNSSTMRACPHDLGQLSLMAPKSLKLRCPRACRFTPYSLRGCRTTFKMRLPKSSIFSASSFKVPLSQIIKQKLTPQSQVMCHLL